MAYPLVLLHRLLLLPVGLFLISTAPWWSPALSATTITHLPGFSGPLPFQLETGYVEVDEVKGVELFYYFIQSEGNPGEDPLLLWLTGGPGCSSLTGLTLEIGPIKFQIAEYNGRLPTLLYNQYSWTKVSNIIFLDSPVGSGFSYARDLEDYAVGDISSSRHVHKFLIKWFVDHPQFLSNHLYIAGDSYSGKVVPVIAEEILEGMKAMQSQPLNLKGYLIGNPFTGEKVDYNSRIPYAHGVGIISDELYQLATRSCEGEDYIKPSNEHCAMIFSVIDKFISENYMFHILEPKCTSALSELKRIIGNRRSLGENHTNLLTPPPRPAIMCRSYAPYLMYYWANSDVTREALNIKKGTVGEWQRCNSDLQNLIYKEDIPSSIKHHISVTTKGYRALVYSGDHDMVIPFLGTQAWIRSLNFSILDDWRSWHFRGQVAGYTRTYANNLTFATVKGAGHTAPEYQPKECLAMFRRWISFKSL